MEWPHKDLANLQFLTFDLLKVKADAGKKLCGEPVRHIIEEQVIDEQVGDLLGVGVTSVVKEFLGPL